MYVVLRPRGTKCTELLIDPIYPSLVLLFFFVSYYSVRIYKRGKVYMDIDTYLQISIHRCLSVFIYRYLSMSRIDDWRRQWHPTPVLLPGKSHGQRSLVGCSPWVAKSRMQLNDFPFTFHFHTLEREMATHSSVLAWRIPGTGECGGLLWGRTESDTTEAT